MNLRTEKFATKCGIAGLLVFMTLAASASTVQFKPAQIYAVSTNPTAVAVGDLQRRRQARYRRSANNGSSNISILLGNGDGTFQPAVNFERGSFCRQHRIPPSSLETSMATASRTRGAGALGLVHFCPRCEVSILLGAGTARSSANCAHLTLEPNVPVLGMADVNGDKKADLIINLVDTMETPSVPASRWETGTVLFKRQYRS